MVEVPSHEMDEMWYKLPVSRVYESKPYSHTACEYVEKAISVQARKHSTRLATRSCTLELGSADSRMRKRVCERVIVIHNEDSEDARLKCM